MTSLIINDNLISSFEELKSELLAIKNSQSTAAQEVRSYFFDGVLHEWLSCGDDNEIELSSRLGRINSKQDDTTLLNNIISTICGVANVRISKIDYPKCISLDSVEYAINSLNNYSLLASDTLQWPSTTKQLYFKVNLKILESYNEIFRIAVCASDSAGENRLAVFDGDINLMNYKQGDLYSFSFCCDQNLTGGIILTLSIDNEIIKSFVIQRESQTTKNEYYQRKTSTSSVLSQTNPVIYTSKPAVQNHYTSSQQDKKPNPTHESHPKRVRVIYVD